MQPQRNMRHLAMVDDDEFFLDRLKRLFEDDPTIRISTSTSAGALFDLLNRDRVDCILLDYDLGADNGFRVAEQINSDVMRPPPIIMLTGGGESVGVHAKCAGLHDYVPKHNISPVALRESVGRAFAVRRKAAFMNSAAVENTTEADFDSETGLYSTAFAARVLDDLDAKSNRRFGIVIVKLASYAGLKKRSGLAIAEEALRAFVLRLREAIREDDLWARVGEASFLCILQSADVKGDAKALLERLTKRCAFELKHDELVMKIRAQIGYAHASPNDVYAKSAVKRALADAAAAGEGGAPSSASGAERSEPLELKDKRRDRRRRVFKRAQIKLTDPPTIIDCTVRNISKYGAGLRFNHHFGLPKRFKVRIDASGDFQDAELRWHRGVDAGIEFTDAADDEH